MSTKRTIVAPNVRDWEKKVISHAACVDYCSNPEFDGSLVKMQA
jgi:hypothetical protein